MLNNIVFLIISIIFFAVQAEAVQIKNIEVSGHRKIEKEAVLNKIKSKEGTTFDALVVKEDILELFRLGYFYNIIVDKSNVSGGVKLTYKVVEKPTVESFVFNGNDEIDDEEIQEAVELKAFQILDDSKINLAIEKIEKLYEDKGYFLAQVKRKVTPVKKGETVNVEFQIVENDKVKVEKVTFLGNTKLTSTKLKSMMFTKEGGYFSFMSGAGSYKQEAFDQDVRNLTAIYYNEGYIQAKVAPPQVYVTPDKKSIYVTIKIDEGEQYSIGSIDFTGDMLFPVEELKEQVQLNVGDVFAYDKLQRDLRALQAKYGDLGYAYANPIPRPRVNEKELLVDLTFEIDKGHKVYFGKISVKGNNKTRDKVLRRELVIYEGKLYNETKKRESIANIKRLGYFEEVNFVANTPKGRHDVQDLEIQVKERSTGTIQVGAGYASNQGFVLNGQVNQINLFGRGQRLGVSVNWSKVEQLFNLNFTEPYFRDTEWELGFDVYRKKRELQDRYKEERTGAGVRIGHPLAPYLRGIFGYKIDDTELERVTNDPILFPVETTNGITSSVTARIVYDKRNDRFLPTKGILADLSLEYAGLGGDRKFTQGNFTFRYYKTLFWEVVWRNNLNYGVIQANESGKEPPFDKLYLLGGANTLRGYDWFTVGKREFSIAEASRNSAGDGTVPFGGKQQFYYQSELQFPLIKEAGVLGVAFFDIGYADDTIRLEDLKSDVGFGFRWYSPVGPLRFEWGIPLNPDEKYDEDSVKFQFAIGSPF